MHATVSASVGFHGINRTADVKTVQRLLNQVPAAKGGPVTPLVVDGICGKITIAAIRKFQQAYAAPSDGCVDPGGRTIQFLNAWSVPLPGIKDESGQPCVPLAAVSLCAAIPGTPYRNSRNYGGQTSYSYTDYASPAQGSVGNPLFEMLAQAERWLHQHRGKPLEVKDGNHGYGDDDGKWSTAAKAAKGSDISQIDLEGLLALISGAGDMLPTGTPTKVSPKGARAKSKAKTNLKQWAKDIKDIKEDPRLFAEFLVDVQEWIDEMQIAVKETRKAKGAASATEATTRRVTYHLREGRPADRLWIWQWDYGNGKRSRVYVEKYGKVTRPWGLVEEDWYIVDSGDKVADLNSEYRNKCQPAALTPIQLPWTFGNH